jgi:outer membrane protein TolC
MTLRLPRWLPLMNVLVLTVMLLIPATRSTAETVPLQRAVELALRHSPRALASGADVQRTFASYREMRAAYIPQLTIGSGLGYSYGFPLTLEGSAPSLINVIGQSTIYNPAQQQFQNAARTEWHASEQQDKDQRNAVIEDVIISYAELAKWTTRLSRLAQDETQAQQMETAVSKRVQEGVDSAVDLNKAKLTTARVHLHLAEARGSADVLRRHLANLTGLTVSEIEVAPDSIPTLPQVSPQEDLTTKVLDTSPIIISADQHAIAERLKATGEHRSLLPSFDFAVQYARLAAYNNYDQFYLNFKPNNATIGVNIKFPFFNAPQRARARAADAEALKAKQQAQATRDQVSEQTLKLQRAVEQLAAAREVAQLEYQLAQSSLDAAQARTEAGTATLHELADATSQASERFLMFQDTDFEYERAQVNLMRITGELEKWALSSSPLK